MKIVVLIVLALVFVWHLSKGLVKAWPFGWPLGGPYPKIDLELRTRFAKEAVVSLTIALLAIIVWQVWFYL